VFDFLNGLQCGKLKEFGDSMTGEMKFELRRSQLFLVVAALVLISDQITKALIRTNMTLGESIPEEGRFRLSYSTNEGAVFGLSLDSIFLTILASFVVVVIVWAYFRYFGSGGMLLRVALGLVLGGAIGNLIDRYRFGEVTDFIDVRLWGDYHWPTFNIADASLTTGIFLIMFWVLMLLPSKGEEDS